MEEGICQEGGNQMRGMACAYIKKHGRTWSFPGTARQVTWGLGEAGMRHEKADKAQDEKDPEGQNKGLGVGLPGARESYDQGTIRGAAWSAL